MGEPIRFELSNGEQSGYKVSVPNLLPNQDDRLAVREDRATEADRAAIFTALHDCGYGRSDSPTYDEIVQVIVDAVFGEEASRV